ncbi:response regulator [Paracraurococcus lichenis]|uniref:Response regulator n=1 Tax=Paracraurococcus lichenis TaxID=3064888 RepID=A0ABT9E6Q3_9PROT|nr:response regulator [Paracraurococcus sp. LOR1-02]MDO9711859.1 response regulator [Paracraurococcus sp. LOR1-02]
MSSILVIEDVLPVLVSLKIVLQGAGHEVATAPNGVAGLELLKGADFDLVVTDIWMRGSSGTDVIREGRKLAPRTRFLAITGGDPNVSGQGSLLRPDNYGADALMLKPFEKEQLLSLVSRLLDRA